MPQATVVGQFPTHRRTIRGPVNPLDKSTIVSIFPKEIEERKPTIQPGIFKIPAGSYENPAILVVGPSSWWRDIDEEQPLLEIPVSSIQIADSVVKDYCNGILACNMDTHMPGMFYVPGSQQDSKGVVDHKATLEWIKKNFKAELDAAKVRQNNWYSLLLRLADSLWARSNGNPLAIADDMRLAAKELQQEGKKDWMKDFQMVDMVRCKACGTLKNPQFPVCAACHFPDPEHPLTKEIMAARNNMPKA
jgi:hypothetical protein